MTIEAQQELTELKTEQQRMRQHSDEIFKKVQKYPYDSYERKGLKNESRKLDTKYYKIEERINEIQKLGLSTKQRSALKRETVNFKTLHYDRNLGTRDKTVIGYSKALGNYVIVDYTSYTSFMGNVRGMGSLAGTKDIGRVRIISKSQYEQITKQQEQPRRVKHKNRNTPAVTNFGGVFG